MDGNNKYVKIKPLGKGSFGSAILIRRKSDGELLVVKEVNLSKMSSKEREEARNECKVLQSLNHPNIVRYIEHYELRGVLYIVMEYADGGDLAGKIKEQGSRTMKEPLIMYYLSQLALALEYLHSRHILHRDIKTMNIFLMKNGAVKLGDFGISTILRNTMAMANTVCGTPYYFSPELCKNRPYNNRSDVWALGVVLYEMMTGKHPFDANSMQQLMQRIVRTNYTAPSSSYTRDARLLLDACLQKEPSRRPNIRQLLAYPCVHTALEKLETDLMLATQCRVRLQDIIEFPSKGSGRSNTDGSRSPPPQHQQIILQQDPRGRASPQPAALQPGPRNQQSASPTPRPLAVQPEVVAKQFNAELERVDAFIRQLNRPVNDRAKDAIQEYMRKKQDEINALKRRDDELKKKQDERKAELKKIMEDHQRQMLEHAKLKANRLQQGGNASPSHLHLAEVPPPPPQPPSKPKRPSLHMYGQATPGRNAKHVLAANSPANAKRFENGSSPQFAGASPAVPSHVTPPSNVLRVGVAGPPKPQAVDKAQNWADRQAERRRSEIEEKQHRRLEDEKRLVRDLDGVHGARVTPGMEPLVHPVVDPELAEWVRRTSVADRRSHSPQPQRPLHDAPAGVDARRRMEAMEAQRNAAAAGAVLQKQHPLTEPNPRTPTADKPLHHMEFRHNSNQSGQVSRSSSCSSEQLKQYRPSDVPQALESNVAGQIRVNATTNALHGGHRTELPIVHMLATRELDNDIEETTLEVPEIIRSFRGPSPPVSPRPELREEVPVDAYAAMLTHLKGILEKKPASDVASRHKHAILDADILTDERDIHLGDSPTSGASGGIHDTEEFMTGGDDDDEEDDDFEDEEPIAPNADDCDGDNLSDVVGEEANLASSFRLRHICGEHFRGVCAVHPSTGAPLFPSGSISRHTNEFQLRIALEKRLSPAGLDAITLQLEALPVGSSMEARILEDIRLTAATYLAKVKRSPTSVISVEESAGCVALCAQLLFFQDD